MSVGGRWGSPMRRSDQTTVIQGWVDRLRQGDDSARVALLGCAEFHGAVAGLAEADPELFDLLWYQGLTQAEAAAILGVTERTVNTRWLAARVRLSDALGGQLPI